jgi:hypothetical protein
VALSKDVFEPGDKVEASGVYKVVHDPRHRAEHEVTVVMGRTFPPCNHCGDHPRFVPIRLAHHIVNHEDFK